MPSLKYLGEAIFFLSASYGIAKWTLRNARDTMPPSETELAREIELPHVLPALVARGVAPPEEIARLTPHERVAMYRAVFESEDADTERLRGSRAAGWAAACPSCGAPLGAGTVPVGFLEKCPKCGVGLRG